MPAAAHGELFLLGRIHPFLCIILPPLFSRKKKTKQNIITKWGCGQINKIPSPLEWPL